MNSDNKLELVKSLITKMTADSGVEFDESSHLFDDGVLDSFAIITLIGKLEEQFNIHIQTEDLTLDNFGYISSIVNLINRYQANQV